MYENFRPALSSARLVGEVVAVRLSPALLLALGGVVQGVRGLGGARSDVHVQFEAANC